MFTKSATPATPVTRPKAQISESVTWVRDWYNPRDLAKAGNTTTQLMGWTKKDSGAPAAVSPAISSDVYNLSEYKYHEEVVEVAPVAEDGPKEEEPVSSDLKSALSMDKKDGQISSLSGLGM